MTGFSRCVDRYLCPRRGASASQAGWIGWSGRATLQPYFIRLKDGLPLAFAALWEEWRDPDGQAVGSCAIIVTRANALVQPIHDRMPVIVEPHAYGPWLGTDITDAEGLTQSL